MEELRNEEIIETVGEELLDEVETSEVAVNDEEYDSSVTTKLIAGGIAVIGLAGYGTYQLGKNIVVPGVKKGVNWIKNHVGKKKEDVVDNTDWEDFEDDFVEDEAK